jgi:hypothetical protein
MIVNHYCKGCRRIVAVQIMLGPLEEMPGEEVAARLHDGTCPECLRPTNDHVGANLVFAQGDHKDRPYEGTDEKNQTGRPARRDA